MKQLRFLYAALFAVLLCTGFTACSDDEEDYSGSDIVGKWYMDEYGEDSYIVFSSDGTGYSYYVGDGIGRFEYTLNGNILHIVWLDGSDDIVDIRVKINGNTMTCRNLTDDEGEFTLTRGD